MFVAVHTRPPECRSEGVWGTRPYAWVRVRPGLVGFPSGSPEPVERVGFGLARGHVSQGSTLSWRGPGILSGCWRWTGDHYVAEVIAVFLGVAFLHIFYRAVETKWPTSYYSIGRKTDETVSRNLAAYTVFRFGPLYVTGVFAGAVLASQGHAVFIPVLLIAAVHALVTSGLALSSLVRSGKAGERPLVSALHSVVIVLLVAVGMIAGVTATKFEKYVPSGQELAVTLWTAVIASVIAAFLVRRTSAAQLDPQQALALSRSRIPDELWNTAEAAAIAANAEPKLVHAFLLVENAQRPRWTRNLERLGGRVFGRGSYGPLQISAGRPMSDVSALTLAVGQRFQGRTVPRIDYGFGGHSSPDLQWLKSFAALYNPDSGYIEDVGMAYQWLEYPARPTIASTRATGPDNLPLIEVLRMERAAGTVMLEGRAVTSSGSIAVRYIDRSGAEAGHELVTLAGASSGTRRTWTGSFAVPPDAINLELSETALASTPPDAVVILPV